MSDGGLLFSRRAFSEVFEERAKGLKARVENVKAAQFNASSDEEVTEHIVTAAEIEPLQLYADRVVMSEEQARLAFPDQGWNGETLYVPSLRLKFRMPFSGAVGLWDVKPSRYSLNPPCGLVIGPDESGYGTLEIIVHRRATDEPKEFKRDYERTLKAVQALIHVQTLDVGTFNASLANEVRPLVLERRRRLANQVNVREFLNIPLARREGVPSVEPLPLLRKIVRPLPAAAAPEPEFTISDRDYEHILSVIRHEGRSEEATPATYSRFAEEELRDVILSHLNGHYRGDATGETFRRHGKTDISIRFGDRAAFVAECKVWRGTAELQEAVDQLLSYVTWRDCKCAMVVYNKDVRGFTDILATAEAALRGSPQFVGTVTGPAHPGEFRFRFKHKDDDKRVVTVHVFFFNLYLTPRARKGSPGTGSRRP